MSTFDDLVASMDGCALPGDIIIEILSNLPVKSIIRFKSISKPFHDLITSPGFVSKHLQESTLNSAGGRLLLLRRDAATQDHAISIFLDENLDAHFNLEHPFPNYGCYIVGCCNGLLCLSLSCVASASALFLWNPATKQTRRLPAVPSILGKTHFPVSAGFGFDFMNNDFKVVFNDYYRGREFGSFLYRSMIYTMSTNSWKEIDDGLPCRYRDSAVIVNGNPHWKAFGFSGYDIESKLIVCFDMSAEVFHRIALPVDCGSLNPSSNWSVEVVRGSLAMVIYSCHDGGIDSLDLWVMEQNESWTKEFSIKTSLKLYGFVRCWKNGELVLKKEDREIFLYDPHKNLLKYISIDGSRGFDFVQNISFDVYDYVESLVMISGGVMWRAFQ